MLRFPLVNLSETGIISTSRGLVGDANFAVIPDIKPSYCFALTIITQMVSRSFTLTSQLPVPILQFFICVSFLTFRYLSFRFLPLFFHDLGAPNPSLAKTDIQPFSCRCDTLRIRELHVRMARPRESSYADTSTYNVSIRTRLSRVACS